MAKKHRSLERRQQASLLSFGVKLGVAPAAVNPDPTVLRPPTRPRLTAEERFVALGEKLIRQVRKKRAGRPIKYTAFVDGSTPIQKCDVDLGASLVAERDYETDPRTWVNDFLYEADFDEWMGEDSPNDHHISSTDSAGTRTDISNARA
ncbi:hypothetical protein CYMTET_46736 [Cymbomonas tetramitiformis]|uniref:Uncharacterized protein n=1 Tax=Cymbomonas tetramitiformis TaxID=36881 RepID=A0AAE0EX03_9CHLO|nr:hypothetical protein CYMTET_46736 [Cymbomonas tetramitiformis]